MDSRWPASSSATPITGLTVLITIGYLIFFLVLFNSIPWDNLPSR